jgi:hypothetical protein
MASESSGTDFGTRIFKFCMNIINVVVIFICAFGDQGVKSIFRMFTSKYFTKLTNSLTSKSSFFDFTKYFNLSYCEGLHSDVSISTVIKIMESQLQFILLSFRKGNPL